MGGLPRLAATPGDESSVSLEEFSSLVIEELGLQETTGHQDPNTYRLIERYFPGRAVSRDSVAERYARGKTAHTIFTWWGRRPFAAVSGVLATSLLRCDATPDSDEDDDHDPRYEELYEGLAGEPTELDPSSEQAARARFGAQRVLDLFAGGATIPLQAALSGTRAYALENNELAHFIQKSLLDLSQLDGELDTLVHRHGTALLTELRDRTRAFYPERQSSEATGDGRDPRATIAYFWSRGVRCPSCEAELSLLKRPWLARRKGRSLFLSRRPHVGPPPRRPGAPAARRYTCKIASDGTPVPEASAWRGQSIECVFCGHTIERAAIEAALERASFDELTAVCTSLPRRRRGGKNYRLCDEPGRFVPEEAWLRAQIEADLAAMGEPLPAARLPRWSGVTNPTLYGLQYHHELFNTRQLATLVRLCRLLREHHARWVEEHGPDVALAIAAFLSGLVDQLVDWNSRLCTWIAQNEQVGRSLAGPGLPMTWDFVEIDPLVESPANLWDKLDRIGEGIRAIGRFDHRVRVVRGDARKLPFKNRAFDVVATDPPYFDNLFYSVLADCVYVWKRLALRPLFPDVFAPETTDRSRELSVNRHDHGSSEAASDFYTDGMSRALAEVRRVLKPDGVLSLIYAHSSVGGWVSIVEAFRRARLELVAAWPMQVERRERPRAMRSAAVNTSFVLVGKRRHSLAPEVEWSRFAAELAAQLRAEHDALRDEGVEALEVGQALLGRGVCACSRYGELREDGHRLAAAEIVERIARLVESMVDGFVVARR